MPQPLKKSLSVVLSIVFLLAATNLALAQRLSVKAHIANIRAEPSTDATVLWQVEKFHPLKVIKKEGAWVQFEDFEGDRGWVHSSLLADIRSVIIKNNKCNVRSGPSTDNDIFFTVDKGVPFRVLENEGKWLHIVHEDGDKGWIHQSLVW